MATAMLNAYCNAPHNYYTSPPSPPMDDSTKCSLPSISNLLDLADQASPTETQHSDFSFNTQPSRPSTRPSSSHCLPAGFRSALPPTPPMTSEASFGHESPKSAAAPMPAAALGNYYFEATPPPADLPAVAQAPQMIAHRHSYSHSQQHHQRTPSALSHRRHASHTPTASQRSLPPQHSLPMVQTASSSSYSSNSSTPSTAPSSVPSARQASPAYSPSSYVQPPAFYPAQLTSLYYQRPLLTFSQPSPWQHHHYISPAAAAAFPQSQDRYICPTCSKAFSRPSSLRIHSHSHTGEKPFKCPHTGCGKAFSVRSNMKRHERGCHNYDGGN